MATMMSIKTQPKISFLEQNWIPRISKPGKNKGNIEKAKP